MTQSNRNNNKNLIDNNKDNNNKKDLKTNTELVLTSYKFWCAILEIGREIKREKESKRKPMCNRPAVSYSTGTCSAPCYI